MLRKGFVFSGVNVHALTNDGKLNNVSAATVTMRVKGCVQIRQSGRPGSRYIC